MLVGVVYLYAENTQLQVCACVLHVADLLIYFTDGFNVAKFSRGDTFNFFISKQMVLLC